MKRLCLTLLIGALWLLATDSLQAQQQQQSRDSSRRFGNGRFLKRVKEDIEKSQAAEAARKAKIKLAQEAKAAQKKLSQAAAKYKLSAKQASTQQQPGRGPAFGPLRAATPPAQGQPTPARAQAAPLRGPTPAQPSNNQFEVPPIRKPATKGPRKGFGLSADVRGDHLVVTRVDPQGNAQEAGLKVGDRIITGGGVNFKSVEDLQQIAEILEDGDQLEFTIERRGKSQQVLLGYGNPPVVEGPTEVPPAPQATPPQGAHVNLRDNYSFLPETEPKIVPSRPLPATGQTAPVAKLPANNSAAIIQQQRQEIELLKQQLQQMQRQINSSRTPRVFNAGSAQSGLQLGGPK